MFNLYSIDNNNVRKQIIPKNDVFIVHELNDYTFEYKGDLNSSQIIFIEDEVLDKNLYTKNDDVLFIKHKTKIFNNYFGYITIRFDNNKYFFDVRTNKLRIQELESIINYLWEKSPSLYDNFFSKSTIKSSLDKSNNQFSHSSKIVNILEDFYSFIKEQYILFKNLPHHVIRNNKAIIDYENAEINESSLDWVLSNLDELLIDNNYYNDPNSFQINNSYAILNKIQTDLCKKDFDVYENQIIMGVFEFVSIEIQKIMLVINNNVKQKNYTLSKSYSIDDLIILPFLKLKDDLISIQRKFKNLNEKFKLIFPDTKPKNSFPKLTSVFSNKKHYREVFIKIKSLRNLNINISGELNLLNIKKLSTLYEVFNLFILLDFFLVKKPVNFFSEEFNLESKLFHSYTLNFQKNTTIKILYDSMISSKLNNTGLQRISEGYYKPDFVIICQTDSKKTYYILDSKYSTDRYIEMHLNSCIKKYILDIGVINEPYMKIDHLILLYPGDKQNQLYGNSQFKPEISIVPSKVETNNLNNILKSIF